MASNTIEITVGFSPIDFGNCFRNSTIEKVRDSELVKHIKSAKEIVKSGQARVIEGKCIPQVKINDPAYLVSITLDSERKINNFACNCTAGAGTAFDGESYKACKHVCALATFINEEREESRTDSACGWSAPSQKAKDLYGNKGKTLFKIFNLKPPEFSHDWSKSPSQAQKENYAKLMEKHGLKNSNLYKTCLVKVSRDIIVHFCIMLLIKEFSRKTRNLHGLGTA